MQTRCGRCVGVAAATLSSPDQWMAPSRRGVCVCVVVVAPPMCPLLVGCLGWSLCLYECVYVHVSMHVCLAVYVNEMCACMHLRVYICTYTCICMCMYVCMCVCVFVCVCVCVCVYYVCSFFCLFCVFICVCLSACLGLCVACLRACIVVLCSCVYQSALPIFIFGHPCSRCLALSLGAATPWRRYAPLSLTPLEFSAFLPARMAPVRQYQYVLLHATPYPVFVSCLMLLCLVVVESCCFLVLLFPCSPDEVVLLLLTLMVQPMW